MGSWHYESVEGCDGDEEFGVEVGKGETEGRLGRVVDDESRKADDRHWETWDMKSYEGKGISARVNFQLSLLQENK